MATRIKLKRHEWMLGDPIGVGGFGRVLSARAEDGEDAVVKLVRKIPGANRELLFIDLIGARNVIPIIDSGEHDDNWAIAMPRADRSLREHLVQAGGKLTVSETTSILLDVSAALADLYGRVVHRDIKPENVLFWNGKWCLADFGISRYAEATTAPDTQKYAMTPQYAAPERWRAERASGATDVYSLGVMAFEMLEGTLPFNGPTINDFREQHLHQDPPSLSLSTSSLRAIVAECLFKAPGARPSPSNLLTRLERATQQRSGGLERLKEAHLAEVARRSEVDRAASEARSSAERRHDLFLSGSTLLLNLYTELSEAIADAAPMVARDRPGKRKGSATLHLGKGELELVRAGETSPSPWNWEPPGFDVVAHAGIILRVSPGRDGYEGRSHSLWYCDAFEAERYQWIECAFMVMPLIPRTTAMRPFLIDPGPEAAKGLWTGMAEFQLAWPLEPVEPEEFIDRWSAWFADAAQGRLQFPSTLPERPTPRNWRQR